MSNPKFTGREESEAQSAQQQPGSKLYPTKPELAQPDSCIYASGRAQRIFLKNEQISVIG